MRLSRELVTWAWCMCMKLQLYHYIKCLFVLVVRHLVLDALARRNKQPSHEHAAQVCARDKIYRTMAEVVGVA